MPLDNARRHRRSIRLHGYDYRRQGAYFVTICTHGRTYLLGTIADGRIEMNAAASVIQNVWTALPARFPAIDLDAFVVMPNHGRGIILLDVNLMAGAKVMEPGKVQPGHPQAGQPQGPLKPTNSDLWCPATGSRSRTGGG